MPNVRRGSGRRPFMVHSREAQSTVAKGAWVRPYPPIAPAGCTVWGNRGKGDGRFGESSRWSQSTSLPPDDWSSEDSEVWASHIYRTRSREISTQRSRGEKQAAGAGRRELLTTRKRARSCPCEACPAVGGREDPCTAHRVLLRAGGPGEAGRTQSSAIPLPLFREGSFKGMLMIPTKSSVGTRERRMDLIRMASPFPVWISCKVGLESKINEVPIRPLHPTFKPWAVKSFSLLGDGMGTLLCLPNCSRHGWPQEKRSTFSWFSRRGATEGITGQAGQVDSSAVIATVV